MISSRYQVWRHISSGATPQRTQGMGERGHGRDEGGLMVGRQLQRAGDSVGPICQCCVCPGDSSWPLCFPTDVATSVPTLFYCPFNRSMWHSSISPRYTALVRTTTRHHPFEETLRGVPCNMLVGPRDRHKAQTQNPKPHRQLHGLCSSDVACPWATLELRCPQPEPSPPDHPFLTLSPHNHNFMTPRGNQNI